MAPENNTEYVRIHLVLQVCLDSETGNVRPIVLELRTQSMHFSGKLSSMKKNHVPCFALLLEKNSLFFYQKK